MTDQEALDRFMRGLDFCLQKQLYIFLDRLPFILSEARQRASLMNQAIEGVYFGLVQITDMK